MKNQIGIEAMAVHVPKRYLDLSDLAAARGVDPAKYTIGLGVKEMAVADSGEDTVALAATALLRLLEQHPIDRTRIGMLAVGTETGVDHSKPIASYVQGCLELPQTMRTFDLKHACYGGTAALMACADWIASGSGAGKVAIAIAADIARYELGSPGEPTQGAGAVAMLVSDDPRLLTLHHPAISGVSSADVHDFWRPHGRREALVDGHYSIECYLEALSGAYRGWRAKAAEADLIDGDARVPSESLARIAYHVPFCKMAQKAHARVRAVDLEDLGESTTDGIEKESFERQVAPSLALPRRIGNAYTASLYLGVAGLLTAEGSSLARRPIGLFSYGSGCTSEFFSAVVGERAATSALARDVAQALEERERIGVEEYERLIAAQASSSAPAGRPSSRSTFRFAGVEAGRRRYTRA
jgi:hydroxymethylglutaryl-CoA synthase